MVMSLLIIRYENKVSRRRISALIKPQWTSESEMEWLLMAPIFAKLPFCGLLLQGRDCPRLSHFRSCKLPKRDQYTLTYKAQQDGGEAVRLFLVPTDRPTFYFRASHCQPAAHLLIIFFFAPAHWFTLHTQCLAPRSWFVFLSRLQLSPNRYKCASVAGKWRAWEVPDWIRLRVHPTQLQMPRGALREERQGAVLEGRALPVVLPFACWWVCPSWWHISHLSFAHTCKIPDPWLQMASHKGWDETTNF